MYEASRPITASGQQVGVTSDIDEESFLKQFVAAVSAGDIATVIASYTDDAIFHFPGNHPMAGEFHGKDEVLKIFRRSPAVFRGRLKREVHDALANSSHGIALLKMTLQLGDDVYEWDRVTVVHMKEGRISEHWIFESNPDLVNRLYSAASQELERGEEW
jgi:ketosteroid isomerase-like protein